MQNVLPGDKGGISQIDLEYGRAMVGMLRLWEDTGFFEFIAKALTHHVVVDPPTEVLGS